MELTFLTGTLSFLILLLISSFTFLFSRKFNLPYTVLLVIVGLLLVPLSNIENFSFINHFKLTPDVLFFIFLPTLLFEASYKIDYRKMIKDWRAI
jgi:CPA1 family monovalent cation:H+ antiporter